MRINAAKPAAVLPTRKAKAASATLFLILGSLFKAIGQYLVESDNVRVIRAAKPVYRRTTERCKVLNPEYSIFRDQPIPGASPLIVIHRLPCRCVSKAGGPTHFGSYGGVDDTRMELGIRCILGIAPHFHGFRIGNLCKSSRAQSRG